MDVITKLQELYKYCLINGDFKLAEEIKHEINKRQVEITKELAENASRRKEKYESKQHPTQILTLAPRLRVIHLAHFLRRAMSAIRYRREQGGMATVSDKSHQEV